MKYLLKFILIICFCFCINKSEATHIIGGEMSYKHLGNNFYELSFKLYRDCNVGNANYDSLTFITIYQNTDSGYTYVNQTNQFNYYVNGFFFQGYIHRPKPTRLPLFSPDSCNLAPSNVCVEEAIMVDTFQLPYNKFGYTFIYQRCCRNNTINNIENPGSTGASYTMNIVMDSSIVGASNSSPFFKKFPPVFICNKSPLSIDHSAFDPDGDSLVYELWTPYAGAFPGRPYPVPSSTPPFDSVKFLPNYSVNNQIGGKEPLKIDPITGRLTAFPENLGQYVVGIAVKEYRNGILIATHYRDFQFNVLECLSKPKATLPDFILLCRDDYQIQFVNKSIGAAKFYWKFGDPTKNPNDTSTAFEPNYTFPTVGFYKTMLITNPSLYCRDTAFTIVKVYNTINGGNFTLNNACENDTAKFLDLSKLSEGTPSKWKWIINNRDSIFGNPGLLYNYPAGNYQIKQVVFNEYGCTDTTTLPLTLYPKPFILKSPDTLVCNKNTITIRAQSNGKVSWSPKTLTSCEICSNTQVTPLKNTTYYIHSIDNNSCKNTDSVKVFTRLSSIPILDFEFEPVRCAPVSVDFNATYSNLDSICDKEISLNWDVDTDKKVSNNLKLKYLFTKGGEFPITFSVNKTSLTKNITVLPPDSCYKNLFIPNTFTPNGDQINDVFHVRGTNLRHLELHIFNRFGEEIFYTNDYKKGWDGTYKGEKLSPQTLYYTGSVTFWDQTNKAFEGNITIIE